MCFNGFSCIGKFQLMMAAIVSLAFIAGNHLIEAGDYLSAHPAYLCQNETTKEFTVPCVNSEFCNEAGEPVKPFVIDWD